MNRYTVARAAWGFAQYLKSLGEEACRKGIAISYDSRNRSREFAELAACVFITNGLTVRFSDELRPVPLLSYAIRRFDCEGGIMLTASHNPKQYNGFKAYGPDGAQLGPEAADRVSEMMSTVTDLTGVLEKTMSFEQASASPLFCWMGADLAGHRQDLFNEAGACIRPQHKDVLFRDMGQRGL